MQKRQNKKADKIRQESREAKKTEKPRKQRRQERIFKEADKPRKLKDRQATNMLMNPAKG